jgi:hypothetical protein
MLDERSASQCCGSGSDQIRIFFGTGTNFDLFTGKKAASASFYLPNFFLGYQHNRTPQKALKALQRSRYIIVLLGLVFEGSNPELEPNPERF